MKAIVINGNPDLSKGNLGLLLESFLKGLNDGGGEYEELMTECMEIKPCKECTADLRFKSPGKCNQNDDMNSVYDKMRESDTWIFVSPTYYNGISNSLKRFLDRMEPLFLFDITDEDYDITNVGSLILLSDCSFWEIETFEPTIDHFEAVAHLYNKKFIGPLLRPHSYAMETLKHLNINFDDIFQAAYDAGYEFGTKGNISEKTKAAFSRILLPKDSALRDIVDLDN